MTIANETRCPGCGSRRATHAGSFDLCPTCLLTTALSIEDDPCPYQVMAPLGEDPRGVTYLAQGPGAAPRYAALKIYGVRDDAGEVLSRYRHWKPVLAEIAHPGLAKLLDVGLTEDGRLYAASEYAPGWLLSALPFRTSVGADARTAIARQLAGAIEAAHAAGAAHLKLDASRVKASTANGAHATVLGLGSALIVDGRDAARQPDLAALANLIRDLGIALPDRRYETAAAIGDAIPPDTLAP